MIPKGTCYMRSKHSFVVLYELKIIYSILELLCLNMPRYILVKTAEVLYKALFLLETNIIQTYQTENSTSRFKPIEFAKSQNFCAKHYTIWTVYDFQII